MRVKRRDSKNRVLRNGESQRQAPGWQERRPFSAGEDLDAWKELGFKLVKTV